MAIAGLDHFGDIDSVVLPRDQCASLTGKWQDSKLLRAVVNVICPDLAELYFDQSKWARFISEPCAKVRLAEVLILLMISLLQEGAIVSEGDPQFPIFQNRLFTTDHRIEWTGLKNKVVQAVTNFNEVRPQSVVDAQFTTHIANGAIASGALASMDMQQSTIGITDDERRHYKVASVCLEQVVDMIKTNSSAFPADITESNLVSVRVCVMLCGCE